MLWVYALNDTFFNPRIAQSLYRSFTAAGGQADFEQPGPFDDEGHRLFFGAGGAAIWGSLVVTEEFITREPLVCESPWPPRR
jgi:hypothetical protein